MLNDPSMRKILAELDTDRELPLGELIGFMQAYNLRFGAATSDRQVRVYEALAPALARLLGDLGPDAGAAPAPDASGAALRSAAKDAFKGMGWDQLQAHARAQ